MEVEDDIVLDDDLDILDIIEYGFPRRIYIRSDYFHNMDDLTFLRRFRLTKPTVLAILAQIDGQLEFNNDLNNSISPINQLLTTLRFYASAGHQNSLADFMGMHQTTVSRIVDRISNALIGLRQRHIKMPNPQEAIRVQNDFFQKARFPRVIGCIDCTHIKIQSPGGEDAEIFRNRKSYFSLNIQVVCDSNLKIMDIVARWPGSSHDMTIFNNSRIRARIEAGEFPNTVLLGDAGYMLRPYFFTPIANPNTRGERLYNESHIRTRNVVERVFGVWKRRFPVLAYGLRCKLTTSPTIVVAAAILHNIAIDMKDDIPPPADNINIQQLNYLIEQGQIQLLPNNDRRGNGYNVRQELINNYFAHL